MPRRSWFALLAIVLVAFLLRLSIAIEYQGLSSPPDAEANPDQVDYEALGWRLSSGAGFTRANGAPTAFRPPGTPVSIAAVYLVCGRDRAVVRVLFCLVSALTCLGAGLLGARLFGNLTGLVAAALLALLPNHAYYAQHMLSEAPFALAIVLAALALARARERTAGLLFGIAFLTRPQSALCLPLLGLLACCGARGARRAALVGFARQAACFALVVLPWMARNRIELGSWAPTTLSGQVFWGAHNPVVAADPTRVGSWMPVEQLVDAAHPLPEGEVAATKAAWGYGLDFLREHPGQIPRFLLWKIVRQYSAFQWTSNRLVYWTFALAWLVVGPLFLLGVAIAWRRSRASALLLLVPMASTLVTGLLFYGAGRFRDADAGLYVVFAAVALCALAPRSWSVWAGEPGAAAPGASSPPGAG
jgi:4-amino-4-deoxy-L-arabinose transferase-like glycosyltransferase